MQFGAVDERGRALLAQVGLTESPRPAFWVASAEELLAGGSAWRDDLVAVDEGALAVSEAVRLLRLPVRAVVPLSTLPRWEPSLSGASVAGRFGVWASGVRLSGLLRVLEQTPLEGVARFDDGALRAASFCGLSGVEALEAMLSMDDAEPRLETTARDGLDTSLTVVLAEDDDSLRALVSLVLENEGYRVLAASDGVEALSLVHRFSPDLVLSDIDMPLLDGWGLLRALKADVATREVPVVLLSAFDDALIGLKAARAGARAYLKKAGRSRELVDTLALLLAPRREVKQAVQAHQSFDASLPAVGVQWLVSLLAEFDARGLLSVEGALGRAELVVSRGQLVSAVAQLGSLRLDGLRARGRAVFSPLEVEPPPAAPPVFSALQTLQHQLVNATADRARVLASTPARLRLNEELTALYRRVAAPTELRVLAALETNATTLEALAEAAGLEVRHTERIVVELLKRGVAEEGARSAR
jgi:CheY-like chemotaxis protein